MTPTEFNLHYQRLIDNYPTQFASTDKANTIAKEVKSLSVQWWAKVVDKVISGNDPFVKLQPLVEAEKRRVSQEESAKKNEAEHNERKKNSTAMGFDAELSKRGAGTLWDAVLNEKKNRGA